MAALSIADRSRVWRGLMRKWSAEGAVCPFSKFTLYNPGDNTGAVTDVDAWVDARTGLTAPDTVGMNGALSVAMRADLTADMKTDLILFVLAMRRGLDYIRRLVGEVD